MKDQSKFFSFLCSSNNSQSTSEEEEEVSPRTSTDTNYSPYMMSPWINPASSSPFVRSPWLQSSAAIAPLAEEEPSAGLLGSLVRQNGHLYSLATDGDLLYTGSDSKNIRVWKDRAEFSGFKSGSGLVKAIVLSGGKIFTGHQDGKIRVWRASHKEDPTQYRRVGSLPSTGASAREGLEEGVERERHHEARAGEGADEAGERGDGARGVGGRRSRLLRDLRRAGQLLGAQGAGAGAGAWRGAPRAQAGGAVPGHRRPELDHQRLRRQYHPRMEEGPRQRGPRQAVRADWARGPHQVPRGQRRRGGGRLAAVQREPGQVGQSLARAGEGTAAARDEDAGGRYRRRGPDGAVEGVRCKNI